MLRYKLQGIKKMLIFLEPAVTKRILNIIIVRLIFVLSYGTLAVEGFRAPLSFGEGLGVRSIPARL